MPPLDKHHPPHPPNLSLKKQTPPEPPFPMLFRNTYPNPTHTSAPPTTRKHTTRPATAPTSRKATMRNASSALNAIADDVVVYSPADVQSVPTHLVATNDIGSRSGFTSPASSRTSQHRARLGVLGRHGRFRQEAQVRRVEFLADHRRRRPRDALVDGAQVVPDGCAGNRVALQQLLPAQGEAWRWRLTRLARTTVSWPSGARRWPLKAVSKSVTSGTFPSTRRTLPS